MMDISTMMGHGWRWTMGEFARDYQRLGGRADGRPQVMKCHTCQTISNS